MRNAGLDEAQDGIMVARRSINKYVDDTILTVESEEELKNILKFKIHVLLKPG